MPAALNLVFCGTPGFAVPTLETLVKRGFQVSLVITQPDRPQGRGLEQAASPVKQAAERLNLDVYQPEKIKNNQELRLRLEKLRPDAIVVVGYGRIIPPWMLELPRHGNINLHASLLPKYRGAAPIQWAIANGEKLTGVTTMRIDQGLDTGDILLQSQEPISEEDTAETLSPRLAARGRELMVRTLEGLETGAIPPQPQDPAQASLAPLLKKEDGKIDFARNAQEIHNRLRGFQPWPGAFTSFRGKTLHVIAAKPQPAGIPEAELYLKGTELLVGCGMDTSLELLRVQPEGKKPMSATDFIHGYRPQTGERLGELPPSAASVHKAFETSS